MVVDRSESFDRPRAFAAWFGPKDIDIYKKLLEPRFVAEYESRDGAPPFFARVESFQTSAGSITRMMTSAHLLRRARSAIERSSAEAVSLIFIDSGAASVDCAGAFIEVGAGDLLFIDHRLEVEATLKTLNAIVVSLALEIARPPRHPLHGRTLRCGGALSGIILAQMRALLDVASTLTCAEFDHALRTLVAIAESARVDAVAQPVAETVLIARASAYVTEHLTAETLLMPDAIAAHLDVSRANLHRLFKPHGGVLMFITSSRLSRAHDMLMSAGAAAVPISTIAFRSGFVSTSHFSRAFRARYGMTPLEAKRAGGQRTRHDS